MLVYSFDCAQHNMGFTAVRYNTPAPLPDLSTDKSIDALSAAVETFVKNVDSLVEVVDARLVDLGAEPCIALRRFLDSLPMPDKVVYEFQMNVNDKSRMISHMIAYHYAYIPTVCVGGAKKNTVCIARGIDATAFATRCPQVAKKRKTMDGRQQTVATLLFAKHTTVDLSHRTFLRICSNNYDGNKLHTSAQFDYWNTVFGLGYAFAKLDDVADSFIQCLAVFPDLLRENAPN